MTFSDLPGPVTVAIQNTPKGWVFTRPWIRFFTRQRQLTDESKLVGEIKAYGGVAVPDGYLACNGAAVSRSTYSLLFTVISTTYGVGNGSTTFNVPDLRGRTLLGTGTGEGLTARTAADQGGVETHQLVEAELPSHNHVQDAHNHTQDAHNHTQDAHLHVQDAHTHVQDTHNHTQDAHNHTQDAHNHTQDAHDHAGLSADSFVMDGAGSEYDTDTADKGVAATDTAEATATNQAATATNQAATATNQTTVAVNQNTTAVNQNTTAINQAETATNQAATATNQATGADGVHQNMPPFLAITHIIRF